MGEGWLVNSPETRPVSGIQAARDLDFSDELPGGERRTPNGLKLELLETSPAALASPPDGRAPTSAARPRFVSVPPGRNRVATFLR